jgi:excisionase family DNA binding protein
VEPLFSYDDVARILGCSVRTVKDLVACGEPPCRRIGRLVRFTEGDVRAYVDSIAA